MHFHDYKRQSIRKTNFNYQQNGWYFVTICTNNREHLFGEIIDEKMILNNIGKIIKQYWLLIPQYFPFIKLDIFTIMPNHIHGILIIDRCISPVGANDNSPFHNINPCKHIKHGTSNSLGSAIRGFKISVTKWCRNRNGPYHPFQRNFHDIIIHDETQLNQIRQYIKNNPKMWYRDRNNLQRCPKAPPQTPGYRLK